MSNPELTSQALANPEELYEFYCTLYDRVCDDGIKENEVMGRAAMYPTRLFLENPGEMIDINFGLGPTLSIEIKDIENEGIDYHTFTLHLDHTITATSAYYRRDQTAAAESEMTKYTLQELETSLATGYEPDEFSSTEVSVRQQGYKSSKFNRNATIGEMRSYIRSYEQLGKGNAVHRKQWKNAIDAICAQVLARPEKDDHKEL